jgi:hypothetical protein
MATHVPLAHTNCQEVLNSAWLKKLEDLFTSPRNRAHIIPIVPVLLVSTFADSRFQFLLECGQQRVQ